MTRQDLQVKNQRNTNKLIPYVGCKSGFSHIFDRLIPDNYGRKIYDVFGGGGGFTFYACERFGSEYVVYNDHNPIIVNLILALKRSPEKLYEEYQKHYRQHSETHYLNVRKRDLSYGVRSAGNLFYLAKNAFSGKIRFNSKNQFNSPMRKNAKCPKVSHDDLLHLSHTIRDLRITCMDFGEFLLVKNSFVYLDPPYMNNTNGHYNATVPLDKFRPFVSAIQRSNKVMISEQNNLKDLGLTGWTVHDITLNRSLQYRTQKKSREIIAVNY